MYACLIAKNECLNIWATFIQSVKSFALVIVSRYIHIRKMKYSIECLFIYLKNEQKLIRKKEPNRE